MHRESSLRSIVDILFDVLDEVVIAADKHVKSTLNSLSGSLGYSLMFVELFSEPLKGERSRSRSSRGRANRLENWRLA